MILPGSAMEWHRIVFGQPLTLDQSCHYLVYTSEGPSEPEAYALMLGSALEIAHKRFGRQLVGWQPLYYAKVTDPRGTVS